MKRLTDAIPHVIAIDIKPFQAANHDGHSGRQDVMPLSICVIGIDKWACENGVSGHANAE